MTAYYNEIDDFAASWLEELIKDDLIPSGLVDRRSIEDITPNELREFKQCHFFAGIGVWPLAARLAGWPDDKELWSGSCPCQPFSAAGKGAGFDDKRHLWPSFHFLIEHRKPLVVVGEQVASKDGLEWFDLVSNDMEGSNYSVGAVDTCAAGFGAPFIGQRLYWMAATNGVGRQESIFDDRNRESSISGGQTSILGRSSDTVGMASPNSRECEQQSGFNRSSGLFAEAHASTEQRDRFGNCNASDTWSFAAGPNDRIPIYPENHWRNAEWLLCCDPGGARFRPVEPGTFPLVDARSLRNRLDEVRGAGNAVNIAQAQSFIAAMMELL